MKKDTKKKNNKKKNKLKTKWKTWMTVVSVIAGVLLISGAVVLGVFLSGGFDEKIIYQEGFGTYELSDPNLFNSQTGHIEIEEGDELKITLPLTDNEATRKDVSLSFVGSREENLEDEGWIGNGSIAVPKNVSLGVPFEVKLLKKTYQDEKGEDYSWIAGGISTLRFAYEDISQSTFDVVIAVDVPVYKTFTYLADAQGNKFLDEGGNVVSTVIKESQFYVMTEFYPKESQYLYSDDKQNISETDRRKKMSFYESKSEFITENYSSSAANKNRISFTAGDKMAENVIINGYTFSDAKEQLNFLSSPDGAIDITETYYQTALGRLSTLSNHKESELRLTIGEASIDHFSVGREGTEIDVDAGATFQLFVQGDREHSPYLNANIYSTSSEVLDNLLKDIAINFDVNGVDPVETGSLLLEYGEKITIDDVDYYRPKLPSEQNVKFSYWGLTSRDVQKITVNIYLLVKDRTQLFALAGSEPQVKHVTLNVREHVEQPIDWKDTNDITILLNHDSEGQIIRETINLSEYVINPENNLYRDAVYFAYFGQDTEETLQAMADAVIGETGYIKKYTGNYSTQSGSRYLFAINGSSLTLSQTSEFTLYYAIQIGEDEESGLYKIYTMCSTFKKIICEEALYTDSVTPGLIDTQSFPELNGEVSINQGSTASISVSYIVSAESLPVFRDEFQKGFLSLVIKDNAGNDISNYFVVDAGTLITEEGNSGKFEYKISARSSVQINERNGIQIGSFELVYDNEEDEPIIWAFQSEKRIVVYKPVAESMTIENNDILGQVGNGVTVSQILNTLGRFETKITVGDNTYESVEAFIKALVGENGSSITIKDQKTKEDTLAGQWRFDVLTEKSDDATVVSISDDGKSFSFKSTDSSKVVLFIQSVDGNAKLNHDDRLLEIVFNITSQGITKIAYDTEEKTYQNNIGTPTTNVARAELHKFGAKGENDEAIDLKSLIKFYTTNSEGLDQEYLNFSFRFNPQYYSPLVEDNVLLSLFGENGMLTLYDSGVKVNFDNSYTAVNIRATLPSLNNLTKIVINKNFYTTHTLQFIIFDSIGAVNTILNLELVPNLSVTNENYPDREGDVGNRIIYAGEENKFVLRNQYTDNNKGQTDNFYSLFGTDTYYILNQNGNYELVKYDEKPANAIGVFNPSDEKGQVFFYDFWEASSRTFAVYFRPEGNNSFALNLPITFIVTRDIKITDQEKKFYILSSENFTVSSFVKVARHDDTDIQSVTFSYEFADYLEINGAGHVVQNSNVIIFDYNVKTIETTLTVSYVSNGLTTKLEEITVYIELYNSESQDIYQLIASKLRRQRSLEEKEQAGLKMPTAQVQRFGEGEEQIDYIVVDITESTNWQFYEDANDDGYNADNGIENWPINPVQSTYDGGTFIRDHVYKTVNNNKGYVISFLKPVDLTYGLNNDQVILSIRFFKPGTSSELAWMYIPLIISGVGYNNVIYKGVEDETRTLENSILKPEVLIEKGVYNEIKAGQTTKILTSYTKGENPELPGLYYLSDLSPTLSIYTIPTSATKNYSGLIKSLGNPTLEGTILLNHLATSTTEDVYIALEYRLRKVSGGSYSDPQVFYYLMKVIPDLTVEEPLYAYNGDAEYITGKLNENLEINLEERFGSTTLNSGLKRFMYSKDIALESQDKATLQALVKSQEGATIRLSMDITSRDSEGATQTTNYSKIIDLEYKESENAPISQDIDIENTLHPSTIADGQIVTVTIIEGDVEISYDEVLELSTLKAVNKVVSVQPSTIENPYQSADQWNNDISISFSEDNNTMILYPKKDETITIVISHSYVGGANGDLSVVNGERTFKFILNEKQQTYAVRFEDGANIQETEEFVKKFKNGTKEGEVLKNIELTVDLLSKSGSAGSSSGTIIPGILQIECTSGEDNLDKTKVSADGHKGFEYDNTTGKMIIYLKKYIDQDKQVIFTLFTKQGYLARIVLNLEANVIYSAQSPRKSDDGNVVDVPELKAGLTYDLVDLISLTNANGKTEEEKFTENALYTITNATITSDDDTKNYVKINKDTKKLTIANLLTDRTFTVNYTITFTDAGFEDKGENFVFSQTYNIKKSLTTPASITKDVQVVAGQTHTIDINELSNVIPTGDEYTKYGEAKKFDNLVIEAQTTAPAFKQLSTKDGFKIETNYISAITPLALVLKITAKQDGFGENGATTVEQVYYVNYTITIAPSVKLDTTYPDPLKVQQTTSYHSDTEMSYEILEADIKYADGRISNGTTFESIVDLLSSSPTFAYNSNSTRLNIYNAIAPVGDGKEVTYSSTYLSKSALEGVLTDANLVVTIEKLENALVEVGNVGNSVSLAVSSTVPLGQQITFKAGRAIGQPSIVVLNITYNNVSTNYEIRLQENAVNIARVMSTDNTSTGRKPGSIDEGDTVTYEKIYLDKTSTTGLTNEGRILHAEMADSLYGSVGDYYLVFTDGTHFYASYPVYIKNDMETKKMDIDLGIGMGSKTFYGAYLTSKFESEKIKADGSSRQLLVGNAPVTEEKLAGYENADSKLFKATQGSLNIYTTSRVQLQYGVDENNVPFRVNYSYYKNLIQNFEVEDALDVILQEENLLTNGQLTLNNGSSSNNTKKFELNYYYMLAIDVDVSKKVTTAHNVNHVEVFEETRSIVEFFGITHPVSGKSVTASDFTSTGTNLSFEIIYFDNTTKADDMTDEQCSIIKDYMKTEVLNINAFRVSVGQKSNEQANQDKIYLYTSAIQNSSGNTYDYSFIPYGARNTGDYVLGKIQYAIDATHKTTFYVILQIMPDYEVQFSGNASNSTIEDDGSVSNLDDIYEVVKTDAGSLNYNNIILTSTGSEGYVSVKHKNGSYTTEERAVSSFDITMPLNHMVDSINYNDENNITTKIFKEGSKNKRVWGDTPQGEGKNKYYHFSNPDNDSAITFTGVEQVVFGNQYYMIEARDKYDFVYKIYFTLVAVKQTPSISNKITVLENGLLDFGVSYEQLSISATKNENSRTIDCVINSELKTPSQNGDVSLLVLSGITAWQFKEKYSTKPIKVGGEDVTVLADGQEKKEGDSDSVTSIGYQAGKFKDYNVTFSDKDKEFFKAPDIESITIKNVRLYTLSGSEVATLSTIGGATSSNSTDWQNATIPVGQKDEDKQATNADRPFATGEGYFYNVLTKIKSENEKRERSLANPRNPYDKFIPGSDNIAPDDYTKNLWQIPRIEDSNIYQDSNVADLRIVVSLEYTDVLNKNIKEICDVSAPISVMRESSLKQNDDKVVEDGVAFDVIRNDDKGAGFAKEQGPDGSKFTIESVINDTLEVLAPAGETISFNIELKDGAKVLGQKTQVRVQNSSNNYQRTFYVPLSRYFGRNVEVGNTVTISDVSSYGTEFYYITSSNLLKPANQEISMAGGTGTFTISAITKDIVYIDNALMLSNNSYPISKYYILSGKYQTSEKTFTYRQTASYVVTGRVYTLVPDSSTGEIIFKMDDSDDNNKIIPLSKWQSAFTLYKGTTANGAITRGEPIKITDDILPYLSFSLAEDTTDSSIGKATMNHNDIKGQIKLDDNFNPDQYIKVVVSLKVTGKRNPDDEEDLNGRIKELATLKLGLTREKQ